MDPYSTHLVLLEKLFSQYKPDSIFEFGMGLYSTPLFIKESNSVTSVEMQSEEWFNKVNEQVVDPKFTCLCKLGKTAALDYFDSLEQDFGMVFVDGIERGHCINKAFERTKVIVTHDTEIDNQDFLWYLVQKPDDWSSFSHTALRPHTTIFYHNSMDLDFSDLLSSTRP